MIYNNTTSNHEPGRRHNNIDSDRKDSSLEATNVDTWVYPLVQMGPFGINMDQTVTQKFLKHCEPGSRISMASAYFNLIPSYIDLILNSRATFDIYTASPSVSRYVRVLDFSLHVVPSHTLRLCLS